MRSIVDKVELSDISHMGLDGAVMLAHWPPFSKFADPDERILVIRHAADTSIFYPRYREEFLRSVRMYGVRSPYIIYTSRIESPSKNHQRLIRAFEQ